ncbi:response regulator transcription factor [Glycomyces sp. A-F 0318]|uniref:response regulator n=1 Tax=Glycomyces amatae TaxID=2881355 RepID=UPI001E3C2599|nr:response regulator transcription factor [Glycomyces amatae]MCD0444209.1 response regulator transcription factor [Glycomyces amatae]
MTIRVLLADDQALVRGAFALLVDSAPDMQVIAEAGDGAEAVALAREHFPNVAVMDVRMPGLDGIEATKAITAATELASVRVLVLTTFETDENVALALRAGASGFLAKDTRPADLLEAIRTVAGGDALLSPGATRALIERFLSHPEPPPPQLRSRLDLTPREREVLVLIARGLSNTEIAERLHVSPLTVKTYVSRILTKSGAHDRAQLVIAAYETGLVAAGPAPS